MNVQSFVDSIAGAVRAQDGEAVADLMACDGAHAAQLAPRLRETRLPAAVARLGKPWSDLALQHLRVVELLHHSQVVEASSAQNSLAQSFYQLLVTQSNWCLPILYVVLRDLRALSIRADDELVAAGQKSGHLEEAARTMNRAFSACATDRASAADASRKWGTYFVVNILFKTYFKLNSTNLCSTVQRSLASADLPEFTKFPMSHQVTFKFFSGVLAFFNERHQAAVADLTFALEHSLPDPVNRRHILNYLIPSQLLLGVLPRAELLVKYPDLDRVYGEFVGAVRTGNVKRFDDTLVEKQSELISRGTWLAIERTRFLVLRTLFRKVWILQDKPTRIPMTVFEKALAISSGVTDCDLAEIECFLAVMIDKGYLKGYLSHEKQTVVLSLKDAFPAIATVAQ
ncbi:COP9 signalosome (CSN) subunit [Polyrhizophydium stewartii]|uniref:COP9 signalosome (CSN) subunit n=1 Tax=Polyrhizophydium stewartii TaxID=2732419 RepID=A0ABR4NKZ4_9FUNG